MNMKNKNNIAEMETKLAQLKANQVDTPAQAKARKLIKPMFITFGVVFFIVIGLIQSGKNEPKQQQVTPFEQASASSGNGLLILNSFVTSIETTLNQKKAITVSLASDSEKRNCSIVVTLDYLSASIGELTNVKRDQPDFDISCNWSDKYYVLSSKHDTYAKVQIIEARDDSPMTVGLNARLTTAKGELATFIGDDIVIEN